MTPHYIFLRKYASFAEFGGCERHILNWFSEIDKKEYKITLVVSKGNKDMFLEEIKQRNLSINITEFPYVFKKSFFSRFFNMLFFLTKIKPSHIVYIQGGSFDEFNLADVLAGFIYTKGKIFMSEHIGATPPPPKTSRYHLGFMQGFCLWWHKQMLFYLLLSHLPKRILAVSYGVKNRLVEYYNYPEKRIFVSYHGIEINKFSPDPIKRRLMREKFNIPQEDIIIVSTARLSISKCLDRLINAFDNIARDLKNTWLFIIGDGPERNNLEDLVEQKVNKSRIRFLGFQHNVSDFLKMSDIFVLSSDNEGLAVALLEAMSTGLIVVSTKTVGSEEIIRNRINGFLVERDKNGILEGLNTSMYLNSNERLQFIRNARKFIEDNFEIRKRVKAELAILGINGKK